LGALYEIVYTEPDPDEVRGHRRQQIARLDVDGNIGNKDAEDERQEKYVLFSPAAPGQREPGHRSQEDRRFERVLEHVEWMVYDRCERSIATAEHVAGPSMHPCGVVCQHGRYGQAVSDDLGVERRMTLDRINYVMF
jgi:hypothetical protein